MGDDRIKSITMNDQQPPAISGHMDRLVENFDPAKLQTRVVAQPFVMIARDVDRARSFAHHA